MTPIETKLKELEKLDKAATPRPWKHGYSDGSGVYGWQENFDTYCITVDGKESVLHAKVISDYDDCPPHDAQLIATYRNETPKLIAALREAVECLSSYSTSAFEIDGKLYRIGSKADKTITRIEKILGEQK